MPIRSDEQSVSAPPRVRVLTSAPVELFWAIYTAQRDPIHAPVLEVPGLDSLRGRLQAFWGDGQRCYTELLVMADRLGLLFATDLDGLLGAIPSLEPARTQPPLASEDEADRAIILERLRRLEADPALRRSYVALLGDCWALVRGAWEAEGMAQAEAVAEEWRRQVERGAAVREVVPQVLTTEHPIFTGMAEEAALEGRLVLSPGYLSGMYLILDLASCLLVGGGFRNLSAGQMRFKLEGLAKRVKTLGDPTRLAILARLAECPATVTDLARVFSISQPTVSTHVGLLREAGLVEARKETGRTLLSVDRKAFKRLLEVVGGTVLHDS